MNRHIEQLLLTIGIMVLFWCSIFIGVGIGYILMQLSE